MQIVHYDCVNWLPSPPVSKWHKIDMCGVSGKVKVGNMVLVRFRRYRGRNRSGQPDRC